MKSDVMRIYYNEWDEPTAAWLRVLGDRCHLPAGHVDTRSIRDVRPDDLAGYEQCHFFSGIGGWPLALRLAGYESLPCWTGSPPCQPFSVAGQQRGTEDERHLAPVWLGLIRECRPSMLFGEQVADAIRHGWLDDLFDALEECGYACGAAVLPACGLGAPHIRKRLFFGAVRLEHADLQHIQPAGDGTRARNSSGASQDVRLADTKRRASERHRHEVDGAARSVQSASRKQRFRPDVGDDVAVGGLAHSHNARPQGWQRVPERTDEQHPGPRGMESGSANSHYSFWSNADWLGCRDGKLRPVEPSTQPLAHGLPARVGRLRGYGNAIVPQVAARFIKEFLGATAEVTGGVI
ncbi:DNA cytosine methyltransferase [Acetobacter malorum]|uniref:DNA cytosine methyltransferase n=1 Tax=Acetobacter malorum TaxID=178901 RepID=UPI0039E7EFC2